MDNKKKKSLSELLHPKSCINVLIHKEPAEAEILKIDIRFLRPITDRIVEFRVIA